MVQDYRAFFALFDWSTVDDWQAQRWHSIPAHPESAYLKAFLMRQEGRLHLHHATASFPAAASSARHRAGLVDG